MGNRKNELLSAEESAQILKIPLKKLYKLCDVFDHRPDDEWELTEGEHFEWLSKNQKTRRFYEEGVLALAKYLQEEELKKNPLTNFLETITEKLTSRRKHARQMLVRRRVVQELQDLKGVIVQGELVFIDRPKIINILGTNGKGLNSAAKREQKNYGLVGREPMEKGLHFDIRDDIEYWSQRGIARIAKNMSENLARKSRQAWTDAVSEVIEDAIEQQRKYLDSFDARVKKAMSQVKANANKKCQATLVRQAPDQPFDLHVHHLFDRSTRPDLAAYSDNLIAIHEDLHRNFHNWHGSGSCEPKHFVDYLLTVEVWQFQTRTKTAHLQKLINRLENLQRDFEGHRRLSID